MPPLGPARSLSYRSDVYTNFNIVVDLLPGWAGGINPIGIDGYWVQFAGIAARLQTIGLGTTAGYIFGYANAGFYGGIGGYDNFISIARLYGDANVHGIPGSGNGSPGDCEYHFGTAGLDNSKAYRFQFIGKGTHLEGRVYDLAVSTNTPIAVLDANTATDSTKYESGPCGVFGFNYSDENGNPNFEGPLDMTWDNYTASYHTPYEIRDNFNDQTDQGETYPPWSAPGWTYYDPNYFEAQAPQISYTFPSLGGGNYGYEINVPAPSGEVGPARGGSYRSEVSYSDFYMSADISNWTPSGVAPSGDIAIGLVARGSGLVPGYSYPGQLDGYSWTWEQDEGPLAYWLWVSKINSEVGSGVASDSTQYQLQSGRTYRMTFTGKGSQLTGRLIDLSTGSTNIVVTGSDSTYTSGYLGLLVSASQTGSGSDEVSVNPYVTFDNFYADTAEPRLAYSNDGAGHAVLKWPATLASIWTLQSGTNVSPGSTWTEVPAGDNSGIYIYYDPTTGLNSYTNSATIPASAPRYFRLNRLDPLAYP